MFPPSFVVMSNYGILKLDETSYGGRLKLNCLEERQTKSSETGWNF